MSELDASQGLILPSGVRVPTLPPQMPTPQPTTKACYLMGAEAMLIEGEDGAQVPRILLRLMAEDGSMVNAIPNNAGDVLRDLTAGRSFAVMLEDRTSTTALSLVGVGPHIGLQVEAASAAISLLRVVLAEQVDTEAGDLVANVIDLLTPLARPSLGRHYHEEDAAQAAPEANADYADSIF